MYTNVIWVKQGGRNYKTHVPRALNRFRKLSCYLPAVMSYYHHPIFFFFYKHVDENESIMDEL